MRLAAIVVGAGSGERLGSDVPKAFVPLGGRPLLAHALDALAASDQVDLLQPVVASAALERVAALETSDAARAKSLRPVAGGARRQDSVVAGLAALPDDVGWVAVHDAARPLVSPEAVERVIEAARRHGAALLAVPVTDTLKRVEGGRVVETPEREQFRAAQTPQVFRIELLREALDKAAADGRSGTDCAQLVEELGVPVHVVDGDPDNRKITTPADLRAAERLLEARS